MSEKRRTYQTLAAGIGIAALGLICLGSGVALLAWRLLAPEQAILLPPGSFEATPTPGVLGTPLLPPPPPDDPMQIVILPVSERNTPTPRPTLASTRPATQTATRTATQTGAPITPTVTLAALTPTPVTAQPSSLPGPTYTPHHTTRTPIVTQMATAQLTQTPVAIAAAPPAIPDRIVIEAIGLNAPVVPVGLHPIRIAGRVYSQWDVPDTYAAGWHQSSAPLGQPGNTVINGHHNTSGEVFRYLITLKPGNIITIDSHGRHFYYVVAQTMTLPEQDQTIDIRQANARWILPTHDERVTLITCWPYSASTHRLVVIALPLDDVMPPAGIP